MWIDQSLCDKGSRFEVHGSCAERKLCAPSVGALCASEWVGGRSEFDLLEIAKRIAEFSEMCVAQITPQKKTILDRNVMNEPTSVSARVWPFFSVRPPWRRSALDALTMVSLCCMVLLTHKLSIKESFLNTLKFFLFGFVILMRNVSTET